MKTYLNDQLSPVFPRPDYVWCVKNQVLLVAKLGIFCIQLRLIQVQVIYSV